ncbi:3490_t:CDS:1, partial [Dentiscutata heterogama]
MKSYTIIWMFISVGITATSIGFLTTLTTYKKCTDFHAERFTNSDSLSYKTNLAQWNYSDVLKNVEIWGLSTLPRMNTTAYIVNRLTITYDSSNNANANFAPYDFGYSGIVGNATNNKTSYPLVSLVTAVDSNTATYFVIYEENKVPTTECLSAPITCFVDQSINSPFTSLSQPPIMAPYGMNDTLSINPHLRFYVCEYSNNDAYSYKWAVRYAQVAYKLVFGLECAKFTLILIFGQCLANCHQYYLINFTNDSIIWIMVFLLKGKYPQLEEAWNALDEAVEHKPKRHLLRILCNTFLHSIPMIVLTIQ